MPLWSLRCGAANSSSTRQATRCLATICRQMHTLTCLLSPVPCLLSLVPCLLSLVPCPLSPVLSSMPSLRRFINQLAEREQIDQVFLVADKQLRANRNGNLYLQLRLTDKSGSLTGMLWNATDQIFNSVATGNYLRVAGTIQHYNGQLQMIVTRIEPTDPRQIDEQDFITVSSEEIDKLAKRLMELLRGVQNVHLRNLAECFLADEEFMGKFM